MRGVAAGAQPLAARQPTDGSARLVVWLGDELAVDAEVAGAKAANLARAARHGLPVLPGFAVTTAASEEGILDSRAVDA